MEIKPRVYFAGEDVIEPESKDDDLVKFQPPSAGTPAALALAGLSHRLSLSYDTNVSVFLFISANAAIPVSMVTKGLRHIRGMKRPKMKNLKLTKKFKTMKRLLKKRSRNFKGKVIDGVHELYTLTAGMMLGMRCSVFFFLVNLLFCLDK